MQARAWLLGVLLSSVYGAALAQTVEAEKPEPGAATTPPPRSGMAEVSATQNENRLRGFYTDMHVGLGYGVKSAPIPAADPHFKDVVVGTSESLGLGSVVNIALGLDVTERLALQVIGGMDLVGGRRTDQVRAVSMAYAGVGARLNLPLSDRWQAVLSPNLAYARADSALPTELSTTSAAIFAAVGAEYFVHVRHFSIGADVLGTYIFSPGRLFVGLAPHLRYTF